MLNVPLDSVDASPCAALAIGTDYSFGTLLDTHSHRRAQFLYGMTGLMEVGTEEGAWVVPPYTGVWIPAGKPHRVRMNGVSTRSVYVLPESAPRSSPGCEVLVVSPLLHALLLASSDVPAHYAADSREGALMQLILFELNRAPTLPLFAPMPRDPALAKLCAALLAHPDIRASADDWARQLHSSPRTFARLFQQQTGCRSARGASRRACWLRCPACRPARPLQRWRSISATTALARSRRCSARPWACRPPRS